MSSVVKRIRPRHGRRIDLSVGGTGNVRLSTSNPVEEATSGLVPELTASTSPEPGWDAAAVDTLVAETGELGEDGTAEALWGVIGRLLEAQEWTRARIELELLFAEWPADDANSMSWLLVQGVSEAVGLGLPVQPGRLERLHAVVNEVRRVGTLALRQYDEGS